MMDKAYEPRTIEQKWRSSWREGGLFAADPASGRTPFCMVIPPPNITGRLHVGHGLNNTLQDILARWKRMQGFDVLWLPGTDHASIATHVMIERELEKEGTTRYELGRDAFMERAWAWKEKYGHEITDQLLTLGASCDWSRERFTLDPGLSRAVREVFVSLYEEGLIYRDRYLINWCPRCRTAVSDLEVIHKQLDGKLWTIRYPLEGGGAIRVATTRPETILGDVAIAVHPDDERYAELLGRRAIVPVIGRTIPVVADGFVDREFGTGAVKVTPGHDPNDFLAGQRLSLEPISVMDEGGRMTSEAGPFAGLDRFECRERLLRRLEEDGLLEGAEDRTIPVGRCQRCDTIVEPLISRQWFVKIAPLAAPALEAVQSGRIKLVPEQWAKTYFEWMRNIRDWCISRQLWWGHRIPAWYCDGCGKTIVAREDPSACDACGGTLSQDPDVLDTWFSSGLWAFSTLGWPETTQDLKRYYPTTVLITGYDIIFFWVARMVMLGIKFMNEVPFTTVFFNGLVRDAKGEKISKMKGNVIDLFDLLDRYGTDAVRFTFAAQSTPGSDIALGPGRLEGNRAFANKIWNTARFASRHLDGHGTPSLPGLGKLEIWDRWILSRSSRVAGEVSEALEEYRFDVAADAIYRFTWHELCDWYLEMSKPGLADPATAEGVRAVLHHVLDRLYRLVHPFMPFISEELWQAMERRDGPASIALAGYPGREPELEDPEAESTMSTLVMEPVTSIRNLMSEMKLTAGIRPFLRPLDPGSRATLDSVASQIRGLTRSETVRVVETIPPDLVAARAVTPSLEIAVPLEGLLDLASERKRLAREIDRLSKELAVNETKLANEDFMSRARPEAIEKVRAAHGEASDKVARLRGILEQIIR